MRRTSRLFVVFVLVILAACTSQKVAEQLPGLNADISKTSVSGLSSGAYMAGQFHLAFNRVVSGVGLVGGGPWACAQSAFAHVMPGPGQTFLNLSRAVNGCMLNRLSAWGVPNPAKLAARAQRLADKSGIDPLETIADDRVYIFAGRSDSIVKPELGKLAAKFYNKAGVPASQIQVEDKINAGHAFVTAEGGAACEANASPFIVDCDYDQASRLLAHVRNRAVPSKQPYSGRIIIFDQTEFTRDLKGAKLAGEGVLYVPAACEHSEKRCHVHIVFHGCDQNREAVGNDVIFKTGMLRAADAHEVIVLFPQTRKSSMNPKGCWDWWGHTGDNFLTKEGLQLKAVWRMLQRLGVSSSAL